MRTIGAGAALLAALTFGCGEGRKAADGFHIPDGDPAKGRMVFAEQRCHSCHQVAGAEFPAPIADPPLSVQLGGRIYRVKTDGELAGAIIDPSHRITAYPRDAMKSGQLSRMGDFSESLSARDVVDLVAFLQTRYDVVPPPAAMH